MANVIQFTIRGINEFSKVFKDFEFDVAGVTKAVDFASTAITGASAAIFAFAKNQASYQDKMLDTANATGITVTKLSELSHWADMNGASSEQLATSLKFLNKNLGEAANGSKVSSDTFSKLGIDIRGTNGVVKNAGDVIEEVADKFSSIKSHAERAELAMSLFGKSGSDIVPALLTGSDSIRKMSEDASKLGVVLDKEASERAGEFVDSIDRAGKSIRGLALNIANDLIPGLTNLTNKFTAWIMSFTDNTNSAEEAQKKFNELIKPNIELLKEYGVKVNDIDPSSMEAVNRILTAARLNMVDLAKEANLSVIKDQLKTLSAQSGAWITAMQKIPEGSAAWNIMSENLERNEKKIIGLVDQYRKFFEVQKSIVKESKDTFGVASWVLAEEVIRGTYTEVDKLNDHIIVQKMLFDSGLISAETYTASMRNFVGYVETATTKAIENEEAVRNQYTAQDLLNDKLIQQHALWYAGAISVEEYTAKVNELANVQESTFIKMYTQHLEAIRMANERYAVEAFAAQSVQESWNLAMENMAINMQTWGEMMTTTMQNMVAQASNGVGDAVAQWAVYGADLGKSLENLFKSVAASMIQSLIAWQVQRLITSTVFRGAAALEAKSQISSGISQAGINAYASAAAIPVVGWAIAPGVAAKAVAETTAIGAAGLAGQFHDGGVVPRTGTYMLEGGEVVVPNNPSRDVANALGGGGVTVGSIHILENATSFDSLLNMSTNEIEQIVQDKILPALSGLSRLGMQPVANGRLA